MTMPQKNPPIEAQSDPYKWRRDQGFFSHLGHPGRGIYHDLRRRLPWYCTDFKDGFAYRVFAGTVRIYFINLLPALAFQLDMGYNTDGFFGINEALLSSALAAIVFSLLSCQPLTVVGVTGLISLFNYTIYDIIKQYDVTLYPRFLVWVGFWSAIFHWTTAILNLCDYMRTVTDFSSQTFGFYVGVIYVIKGCEELGVGFHDKNITNGFGSALVAILYFATVYSLEQIGQTAYTRAWLRTILSDYAYPLATIFWTGFTHLPGNVSYAHFEYLPVTRAFLPTTDRPWVVAFWTLPIEWIFVAIPFGFLVTLLFYYDHNVSSLTAQARNFPLRKPAGFHWDFFLLGCTCLVGGMLNIPLPNGLVPQAPVHTDSLTYYEDKTYIVTTESPMEPKTIRRETVADRVAEQRISHLLMGLALIGTMTGPLLSVISLIPRAIVSGVFFTVGMGSILTNPVITHKLAFLLRDPKFQRPSDPLNTVKRLQIWHYLLWQFMGFATSVTISQTVAAIGFPVMIVALIPLRWKVLPRLFTRHELEVMDCLTATGPVVLASLGGKPDMPEATMEKDKRERPEEDVEPGFGGMGGDMVRNHEDAGNMKESEKDALASRGTGYNNGGVANRTSNVVAGVCPETHSRSRNQAPAARHVSPNSSTGRRGRSSQTTLPDRPTLSEGGENTHVGLTAKQSRLA
ncbi:hypothetical protein PV11_05508 [Exophiala sideris]|uniref:Bicarbonate transporter-like transmembrane domain-containing protein n=1 Tax=Exophiala sideris TaxID=1016849 RepID=A0A0D1YL05_9EURO|nr:hypothetical protein PV11_05508 [Exophiala sideris]